MIKKLSKPVLPVLPRLLRLLPPPHGRKKRKKHGLQAHMLSDRDLAVTDAFGLRNMGFHSGNPRDDVEALPVPTSLLIGADGRVLWKDQSENYQRRSGPEIVLAALRKHLD